MHAQLLSLVRLLRPHGLQPTRTSIHGIFQARVLEWGAIAFSVNSGLGILYLLGAGILGDSLSALGHGVLGSSPGSSKRTAVWISLDVIVECLL